MLEYEWGNPSSMLLSAGPGDDQEDEEPTSHHHHHQHQQEYSDQQTRLIFDSYHHHQTNLFPTTPPPPPPPPPNTTNHYPFLQQPQQQQQHQNLQTHLQNTTFYNYHHHHNDPGAYELSYPPPHHHQHPTTTNFSPESMAGASSFMMRMPKNEDVCGVGGLDFPARIGLNLGGRTYFSSSEDDFVNRLYRGRYSSSSRPLLGGEVVGPPLTSNMPPRCQAEGCNADLTHAKHYHRRHKVCEFHSKAATVLTAGLTQRFCQQCSRFHLLADFDQGKRSCRKRLADHNRRRRKSQPQQQQSHDKLESTTPNSSSPSEINPAATAKGSSPDSGAHSSSSVTVAAVVSSSPPRMSLGCSYHLQQPAPDPSRGPGGHNYQASGSSSSTTTSSSSSLFSATAVVGIFRPYGRRQIISSSNWDEQEAEDRS